LHYVAQNLKTSATVVHYVFIFFDFNSENHDLLSFTAKICISGEKLMKFGIITRNWQSNNPICGEKLIIA